MLYLEDYLEMIEHLPQQFRDTLTQMRELDLQVHNDMDNLEAHVNKFFNNAHLLAPENRNAQFDDLKKDYFKALDIAEEKVSTANQLYDLVDKYLRKLEQELHKFKIELEADNAGITEILEKRSLELDNPPISASNHMKEKRKMGFVNQSEQKLNSMTSDKLFNFGQDSYNSVNNFGSSKQNPNVQLSQSNFAENQNSFAYFNSKLISDKNALNHKLKCTITGNNAIAAAASQAIAATQQMQLGRRTASLKASYEAINSGSGFPNFNINSMHLDDSDSSAQNMLKNSEIYDLEKISKKSRINKKSRTSGQYNLELNNTSADVIGESWTNHDDEKYCICNNFSYGEMIYCESTSCPYGNWFHYECVGINKPPKGSWYCSDCSKTKTEKKKRKEKVFQ